jgi:hypothetical protein
MTGRCTMQSVDPRPFFIERGSTVRVRQRASRRPRKTRLFLSDRAVRRRASASMEALWKNQLSDRVAPSGARRVAATPCSGSKRVLSVSISGSGRRQVPQTRRPTGLDCVTLMARKPPCPTSSGRAERSPARAGLLRVVLRPNCGQSTATSSSRSKASELGGCPGASPAARARRGVKRSNHRTRFAEARRSLRAGCAAFVSSRNRFVPRPRSRTTSTSGPNI